jgi:hypothetical protein
MAASAAFDVKSITEERNRRGIAGAWTPQPERIPSSLTDTDKSTQQTVAKMGSNIINDALPDPKIQAIAQTTNGRWGSGLDTQKCWDIFWFVKHNVKFEADERAVLALLNETDQIDFLISPSVLMRMPRPAGDCDDMTQLVCALLLLNSVPCEIVTIAADSSRPGEWSHVYCRAILSDGRHMPIDPTNGAYPGWEVPGYDIQKMQAWDLYGKPIPTAPSYHAPRLQGYRVRGMGQDGGTVDLSGVVTSGGTVGDVLGSGASFGDGTGITLPPSSTPSSSGSSINWGTVLSSGLQDITKITQQALLPSGSSLVGGNVISPSGAAGGAFLGINASGQQTLGGVPIQTLMLLGVVALIVGIALKAGK